MGWRINRKNNAKTRTIITVGRQVINEKGI
jgi:hypothetical protein